MDLYSYYRLLALMKYNWGVSLTEFLEMLPFERDLMVDQFKEFDKKVKQQ